MKSILVIYKSKTGFTKKYAEWIAEELNCTALSLEKTDISDISKHDIVIFGGSIFASRINGIKFITSNMQELKQKHLIIFATGLTPISATEEISKFKETNIPNELNIPFFYYQGGMNYDKLGIGSKIIMNFLKFALKNKKTKSDGEKDMLKAISNSLDNSSRAYIKELINYVKAIN